MDNISEVNNLIKENNGIITSKDVENLSINRRILTRMVERGLIERVSRGVYVGIDTIEDTYFTTQIICKKGIFSHETALYFHNLSDRTPIKYQLTIPSGYNTKLLKDKKYKFFYVKQELYKLGITDTITPYGKTIKLYDVERTICDIVRNKNKIEPSLFVDAMQRYVDRKDRDFIKLYEYAKEFKIEEEIRKYIEVLL